MAIAPIKPTFTARSVAAGRRNGTSTAEDGGFGVRMTVADAVVRPSSQAMRGDIAVEFDARGA